MLSYTSQYTFLQLCMLLPAWVSRASATQRKGMSHPSLPSSPPPSLPSHPPTLPPSLLQVAPHAEGAVGVLAEGLVGRMRVEPIRAGETSDIAELEKLGKSLPSLPPSLPPFLPRPIFSLLSLSCNGSFRSPLYITTHSPSLPPSLPIFLRPSHPLPLVHPPRRRLGQRNNCSSRPSSREGGRRGVLSSG